MFNRQNYLFKEVDRISSKACNMYQLIDVFILIHNNLFCFYNSCIVKKEQEKLTTKKKLYRKLDVLTTQGFLEK